MLLVVHFCPEVWSSWIYLSKLLLKKSIYISISQKIVYFNCFDQTNVYEWLPVCCNKISLLFATMPLGNLSLCVEIFKNYGCCFSVCLSYCRKFAWMYLILESGSWLYKLKWLRACLTPISVQENLTNTFYDVLKYYFISVIAGRG